MQRKSGKIKEVESSVLLHLLLGRLGITNRCIGGGGGGGGRWWGYWR